MSLNVIASVSEAIHPAATPAEAPHPERSRRIGALRAQRRKNPARKPSPAKTPRGERRGAGPERRGGRPRAPRCAVHDASAPRDAAVMARTRARPAAVRSHRPAKAQTLRARRAISDGTAGRSAFVSPRAAICQLTVLHGAGPQERNSWRGNGALPRQSRDSRLTAFRRGGDMRGLLGDGPVSTPRIRDPETPTAAPPPPSDTIAKRLSVGGGMERRISGAVGVCQGFSSYMATLLDE